MRIETFEQMQKLLPLKECRNLKCKGLSLHLLGTCSAEAKRKLESFLALICSIKAGANGGKAVDYNKSSKGENEEDWSPKFVQEAKSKIEDDVLPGRPITQDDPAAVEKAKEKFWGRIAVISLGVKLFLCCSLHYTIFTTGILGQPEKFVDTQLCWTPCE